MKKRYVALGIVAVAAGGIYGFREPLLAAAIDRVTANMFVPADVDPYDPGVAVGQSMPAIRALLDGREVTDVGELMGSKGLVIFVNRSVDW
jgi:hypothetical protein